MVNAEEKKEKKIIQHHGQLSLWSRLSCIIFL